MVESLTLPKKETRNFFSARYLRRCNRSWYIGSAVPEALSRYPILRASELQILYRCQQKRFCGALRVRCFAAIGD